MLLLIHSNVNIYSDDAKKYFNNSDTVSKIDNKKIYSRV